MLKEKQKFYACSHCGNIYGLIDGAGTSMTCCGGEMTEIVPNTTDASVEKHVPVIKIRGNMVAVEIGAVPHPMTEQHHISWIYIQTVKGGQRKALSPNDKPSADFALTDDDPLIAAFAYCNLHGLWMADAHNT